jgi:hypothetical protein
MLSGFRIMNLRAAHTLSISAITAVLRKNSVRVSRIPIQRGCPALPGASFQVRFEKGWIFVEYTTKRGKSVETAYIVSSMTNDTVVVQTNSSPEHVPSTTP